MTILPITYAAIDLDAIAHNVRVLKQHVGTGVTLIAVVKANAYGHGAVEVSRAVLRSGAERLAVARVEEAVALRHAGIGAPILVMNYTPCEAADIVVGLGLTVTVNEIEIAHALAARAEAHGCKVSVHVKVDTGMGRFGLPPRAVLPFLAKLSTLPALDVEGMFTHFAVADARSTENRIYTRQQLATFLDVLQAVQAAGYSIRMRHAANSAATLALPESHLDAVRPGIAIYGLRPSEMALPCTLRPALALRSRVARVHVLPTGASISYGRTYITDRPTPVALVPVGYGDGYHRLMSNRGAVLIKGRRAPIVGRVCMDQLVVNVTGIPGVQCDDEVVLIGRQGAAQITAEEVAAWGETINYEVVTSLLPRAARIYAGTAQPGVHPILEETLTQGIRSNTGQEEKTR